MCFATQSKEFTVDIYLKLLCLYSTLATLQKNNDCMPSIFVFCFKETSEQKKIMDGLEAI